MTMRILDVYPELMNLYGERGNMLVLEKRLKEAGCDVVVDKKQLGEAFDVSSYDMVYMGCGTESASLAALEALREHEKAIRKFIDDGKTVLLTGNAFELFGKAIDIDGKVIDGLGIFGYNVERTSKKRYLGDIVCNFNQFPERLIGFINKCSKIVNVSSPLFNVEVGLGNDNTKSTEGFVHKNLYATSIIGPILVRNPHFLMYIINTLFKQKGERLQKMPEMPLQMQAYKQAMEEFNENLLKNAL